MTLLVERREEPHASRMAEVSLAWAIESRLTRQAMTQYGKRADPPALMGVYHDPSAQRSPDLEGRPYLYATRARARAVVKEQANWLTRQRVVRVRVTTEVVSGSGAHSR